MSSDSAPSQDLPATPRARSSRRWILAGVVVCLIGLGIRGWLHQQPFNSDDVQYFTHAQQMSLPAINFETVRTESPSGYSANSLRFVFLSIPAVYSSLLGTGPEPFYGAIFTMAVLSFIGIFAFAWVLSGPRVAVIASVVWATSYATIAVDTRLAPDNMGTALALLGLALIAYAAGLGRANGVEAPASRKKRFVYPALGGFLLWAAFQTRASFFIFALLGVTLALLADRDKRWLVVAGVVAGGVIGELVEMIYLAGTVGDPWLRFKLLLNFGGSVAASGASGSGAYAGYSAGDLFTRYPRILWGTDSAEFILHFVGLAIFIWWATAWRKKHRLAKAVCGLVAYGFLAFAITNLDPVVPLMREKLRYYATAAPLFHIAVAELGDMFVFRKFDHRRLGRWLNGRLRLVAAGLLAVLATAANLVAAADSKQFAKNGNDGMLVAAEVLETDSEESGRPRVLYQDMRTSRVTNILLPDEAGWRGASGYTTYLGSDFEIGPDGYLLLNWKRLNANVRSLFLHGPRTHNYYRMIETQPLVARHRRGAELIDIFFIRAKPIEREIVELGLPFPSGWSRVRSNLEQVPLATSGEVTFGGGGKNKRLEIIFSGVGAPWRPGVEAADGERFVQVITNARAPAMTRLRADLFWWGAGDKKPQRQYMGAVWVGPEQREYSLWTYLPQDARAYRMLLRAKAGLVLADVKMRALSRHPDDRVRQFGDAWPEVRDDAGLEVTAGVLQRDAKSRSRPKVLYDELSSERIIDEFPERSGWLVAPRRDPAGRVFPASDTYVALDWGQLLRQTRGSGYESARAHRYYRAFEDSFVVHRYRGKLGFIDVLFAPPEPIERPVLAEDRSFPVGWSRLLNSTKEDDPIAATGPATFASEDPNDEYIYSGSGPVWRAPPDSSLAGDAIVSVSFDARAELGPGMTGKTLRAALFWWPEGSAKAIRQPMGEVRLGSRARQFTLWTYLPRAATSHRMVFRSSAGAAVSSVRIRALGRVEGDSFAQRGGAW